MQAQIIKNGFPVVPGGNFQVSETSTSGFIDELLTAVFAVFDGVGFSLEFSLIALLLNGEGFLDVSNTATFFLVTSEGVTLTPDDTNYLSNPAFNEAAIPLPAAFPLFATALAGMGLMGWRRKRKAAA